MVGVALMLTGSAWAECPAPGPALASAESDVLDFFLADAQAALSTVRDAWGCGEPAQPDDLARYWAATGMVQRLQGAEGSEQSFAAGRRSGSAVWNADYGEEARALWDAASPLRTPVRPLEVRGGLGDGEQAWLDGALLDGPLVASPGLHVLQVGLPGAMRFAKVLDVGPGEGPVRVDPPDGSRLPQGDPAPVPQPAQPDRPAPVVRWTPPLIAAAGVLQDSRGQPMDWKQDVVPLAVREPLGARAVARIRRAPAGQLAGLLVAGGAGYTSYLFLWDLTTGHGQPDGLSGGVGVATAAIGAGALGLTLRSLARRPARRRAVLDAAERVLTEAP